MNLRVPLVFVSLFLLLCLQQAVGQGFTTKGTDFWLGFMENYTGDDTSHSDRMKVYITTDNLPATGVVAVPLGGWSQTFNIPPNSTAEITIPTLVAMCTATDAIENKGIHVTSDNPVSVYQLNYVQYTSDANINIPTLSLGKKYRVTTYQPSSAQMIWTEVSVSELLVVAAFDNTRLRVTPKCNTQGGHGANVTFNVTLNAGEVYPIKSYASSQYSLTGSLIELDTNVSDNCKPFAVFAGNLCAFVPGDSCCCNHICEQMMPINSWGKQYITVPLKTRSADVFRIVGQQNGTIFTINGGLPHGLNAGGFYEEALSTASFIDSNYPVSVAQFSESAGMDGNQYADPFMIMINPLEQTIKRIVFNSFVTPIISSYYLNIVTRTAFTNLVVLDGSVIAGLFLPVAGNPQFSYAQVTVTQGNHVLRSDSGLIANVYGYGWYETYGYIAGATVRDLVNSFNITANDTTQAYYDVTDTLCRGTSLTFSAIMHPFITNYFWDFGDGSPLTYGQTVTHTFPAAGSYHIKYYYEWNNICAVDSILWTLYFKCCNPSPFIEAISPVCINQQSAISEVSAFNPAAAYTWIFNGGIVMSGNGQGPYQVYWTVPGTDTIWVHISEQGCPKDSAFSIINVNPVPTSTFNVSSPLCTGEKGLVTYTGNASSAATYAWNFDGGHVIHGTGQGPYTVSWASPGLHTIFLSVTEGGCSSTASMPVTVLNAPIPLFSADPQSTWVGEPLIHFYDLSVNASGWSWNFGDTSSGIDNSSSLPSPSHFYYNQGTYTVWLTTVSSDGCVDSTSENIQVFDLNTFYIPNAFTPNGNGINDIFQPFSTSMNYTLYIFNRWGQQIFMGRNEGWNGTYKGEQVKQDIYVWLLHYSFAQEKEKIASGIVTVLK